MRGESAKMRKQIWYGGLRTMRLKDVAIGTYIKRKETSAKVYIRDEYVRGTGYNKYSCADTDDMSKEILLKGNTMVWVDFTH